MWKMDRSQERIGPAGFRVDNRSILSSRHSTIRFGTLGRGAAQPEVVIPLGCGIELPEDVLGALVPWIESFTLQYMYEQLLSSKSSEPAQ